MSFFSNLKIGPRLGFAFATVIALAAVVVVIGITRLAGLNESLYLIGSDRLPKVVTLVEIGDDVNLVARELRNQLIWDDPAKQAGSREVIQKSPRDDHQGLREDHTDHPLGTGQEAAGRHAGSACGLHAGFPGDAGSGQGGQEGRSRSPARQQAAPAQHVYMDALEKFKNMQIAVVDEEVKNGEAKYQQAKWLMFGLLAAMGALGTLLGWWITRSITRPVAQALDVAEKVAAGDLGSRIEVTSTDEVGRLLSALKDMNQSLVQIVGTVRSSSDSIATGSAQIASGNADLSQRAADRRLDGAADSHGQAQRRQRAPGQPAGERRVGRGRRAARWWARWWRR
jgi:methyl-accepting chemotaxis protein